MSARHWSVEIKIDGENKLYISHNELAGVDNVADYTDEIRHCAHSLLGFIGEEAAQQQALEAAREALALVEFLKSNPVVKVVNPKLFTKPERKLYWASDEQQWEVYSRDEYRGRSIVWHYKGDSLAAALRKLDGAS